MIQPNMNHYSWADEVTKVQVQGTGPLDFRIYKKG